MDRDATDQIESSHWRGNHEVLTRLQVHPGAHSYFSKTIKFDGVNMVGHLGHLILFGQTLCLIRSTSTNAERVA